MRILLLRCVQGYALSLAENRNTPHLLEPQYHMCKKEIIGVLFVVQFLEFFGVARVHHKTSYLFNGYDTLR